jgi:type IV secretory pathway protease TraF
MKKDRLLTSMTVTLLIGGIIALVFIGKRFIFLDKKVQSFGNTACVTEDKIENFNDPQMHSLIPQGSSLGIFRNHYACNPIERGHWVLYEYDKNKAPLVRVVLGLPEDTYSVMDAGAGQWKFKINDEIVLGDNQEYWVQSETPPKVESGVLGKDEYLLFSHKAPGQLDSGTNGIVSKKNIVGRIVTVRGK